MISIYLRVCLSDQTPVINESSLVMLTVYQHVVDLCWLTMTSYVSIVERCFWFGMITYVWSACYISLTLWRPV